MTFFLITTTNPTNPEVVEHLLEAAAQRDLEVERINSDKISLVEIENLETSSKDIFYREALGAKARAIEGQFVLRSEGRQPAGIRYEVSQVNLDFPWAITLRQQYTGIPIVPTLFLDGSWKQLPVSDLEHYVEKVDGFPVILKQTGLSHGKGVQRIESAEQLSQAISTCSEDDLLKYTLRKYLASYRHARLIVLGNKVVDSIEYLVPEDDFRTNATKDIKVVTQDFEDSINNIAIEAAKVSGVYFGGADVLIDQKTNIAYLAEFNTPCNFARAQNITGRDTAGAIVDFLLQQTNS